MDQNIVVAGSNLRGGRCGSIRDCFLVVWDRGYNLGVCGFPSAYGAWDGWGANFVRNGDINGSERAVGECLK